MLDREAHILAHGLPDSFHVQTQPATGRRVIRAVTFLWLLFAGRLLTAAVLVPPWQNPDEHLHVAVIRALTYEPWLEIANRRKVDVQAEILRSMAEHGWWVAYSEPGA